MLVSFRVMMVLLCRSMMFAAEMLVEVAELSWEHTLYSKTDRSVAQIVHRHCSEVILCATLFIVC